MKIRNSGNANFYIRLVLFFSSIKIIKFEIVHNVGQQIKQCMNYVHIFEHPCQRFSKDFLLNLYIRFRKYTTVA